MSDEDRLSLSRRGVLAGAATTGGLAAITAALGGADVVGNLYGGTMALDQAYNVAGDLYIGPDAAKSDVSPSSGRVYQAVDTQLEYYGDGSGWVTMGTGSADAPVPEGHFKTASAGEINNKTKLVDPSEGASGINEGVEENATIWVRGGATYHLDSTVELHENGVTLESIGGLATFKTTGNHNAISVDSDAAGSDVEDVTVRGIEIDGDKANVTDPGTSDQNQGGHNGIFLYKPARATIENCLVHGFWTHGIHPDGAIESTIRNNWIWNIEYEGIHGGGASINSSTFRPVKSRFEDNTIWNVGSNGIRVTGDDTSGSRCWIIGNDISANSSGYAIHANNHPHAIRDNSIFNSTGTHAIYVNGQGSDPSGATIEDNYIETPATNRAIQVSNHDNATIDDNRIILDDSTVSGIRADGCNGVTADGNKITGTMSAGVRFLSSGGTNFYRCKATHNVVEGTASTGIGVSTEGVETVLIGNSVPSDANNPYLEGTRTIINGRSTNSGDPSSAGQWNTHATAAYRHGIVVEDTSVGPSNLYRADDGGNWLQIA